MSYSLQAIAAASSGRRAAAMASAPRSAPSIIISGWPGQTQGMASLTPCFPQRHCGAIQLQQIHQYSTSNCFSTKFTYQHQLEKLKSQSCSRHFSSSNNNPSPKKTKSKSPQKMIPRKAALNLTPKARTIFKQLIDATNSQGIMLKYEISSQHALRMAFKFDLIKGLEGELSPEDEGVSLELLEDGITPKPPIESWNDNLPKLYIHHNAFMKVLGGTLDVKLDANTGSLTPVLLDRNGHEMDPNA